ncbi:MAG: hypothetical protein KC777_10040 [Cyanobacteria bacterium HKST-UBA02]|nr:hypothetical protein [Cyanobacteria bacterium HKST-UBA02]
MIRLSRPMIFILPTLTISLVWSVLKRPESCDARTLVPYIVIAAITLVACSVSLQQCYDKNPKELKWKARVKHYLTYYLPFVLIARFIIAPEDGIPPELFLLIWPVFEETHILVQRAWGRDTSNPVSAGIQQAWGCAALIVSLALLHG